MFLVVYIIQFLPFIQLDLLALQKCTGAVIERIIEERLVKSCRSAINLVRLRQQHDKSTQIENREKKLTHLYSLFKSNSKIFQKGEKSLRCNKTQIQIFAKKI